MRWTMVLLSAALAAGACKVRVRDGSGSAEGLPCDDSDECPLSEHPCRLAMCMEGQCVHVPAPSGPLGPEAQQQGDCRQLACDGNGSETAWGLLSDVPPEDGNPCTEAVCSPGGAEQRAKSAGAPCDGAGVCNGKGACGVCLPGVVKCDGATLSSCNELGQWGEGKSCPDDKPVCSARASNGSAQCVAVAQLDAGDAHGCARFGDGTMRCWGSDQGGQLGSQGITQSHRPDWADSFVQHDLGRWHACGVHDDGTVWCWGANEFGQLGTGDFVSQSGESEVIGLSDVLDVAVGDGHSCARKRDGSVWCWGRNDFGQLGSGTAPPAPLEAPRLMRRGQNRQRPMPIVGLDDVTRLTLDGELSCAHRGNGELSCFGAEYDTFPDPIEDPGEEGPEQDHFNVRVAATSRAPVQVNGLSDAAQLACGGQHCCAKKVDGSVWCWGAGGQGQLGDGGNQNRFAAVKVDGLGDVSRIELGTSFGCALQHSGAVSCWGANDHGQLGRGTFEASGKAATVPELDLVAQIALGEAFACALTRGGRALCWGAGGSGQLGLGHANDSAKPAQIAW